MTTPTQEEKDRALEWVRSNKCDCDDIRCVVERCHLHATAELARAEERIRGLREALTDLTTIRRSANTSGDARYRAASALDQDDKLARGESEETKMEAKFTPKPGDRVVLKWSPDVYDRPRFGETFTIVAEGSAPYNENPVTNYWRCRDVVGEVRHLHKMAVFAPAPAKHADDCNLHASHTGACRFVMWDHYHPDDCACRHCPEPGDRRPDSPAPAQAEQTPAVASGVAAGEVTDGELDKLYNAAYIAAAKESGADALRVARRAVYNAGRASRDAEVAEFRRALGSARDQLDKWRGVLGEKDAEVAELKRELQEAKERLDGYSSMCAEAEQALEAEKAAKGVLAEHAALLAKELSDAQKARAVPSVDVVARAISVPLGMNTPGRVHYEVAQTILSLFASPPASPDNTPPEPSTDRARLEAEGWCFDAPPESEVGQMHEVIGSGVGALPKYERDSAKYQGDQKGWYSNRFAGSLVLLSHGGTFGAVLAWRRAKPVEAEPEADDMRGCYGTWLSGSGGHVKFGGCDKVATWVSDDDDWAFCDDHFPGLSHPSCRHMRRARYLPFDEEDARLSGQAKPPDAGIEAVKAEVAELTRRLDAGAEFGRARLEAEVKNEKRLDELELQGRVVKKMLTGRMQHTQSDKQAWESIEREERERNK